MARFTAPQQALLAVLDAEPRRGFDLAELADKLGVSEQGAAMTASSLLRRRLVVRFVGGVGRQRVHFQSVRS